MKLFYCLPIRRGRWNSIFCLSVILFFSISSYLNAQPAFRFIRTAYENGDQIAVQFNPGALNGTDFRFGPFTVTSGGTYGAVHQPTTYVVDNTSSFYQEEVPFKTNNSGKMSYSAGSHQFQFPGTILSPFSTFLLSTWKTLFYFRFSGKPCGSYTFNLAFTGPNALFTPGAGLGTPIAVGLVTTTPLTFSTNCSTLNGNVYVASACGVVNLGSLANMTISTNDTYYYNPTMPHVNLVSPLQTNSVGQYSGSIIPGAATTTITPDYQIYATCAPTVNDLDVVRNWILGKYGPLFPANQVPDLAGVMAADVNYDGTANTADVIKMNGVMMGTTTKAVAYNNLPWRYSTETYYTTMYSGGLGYPLPVGLTYPVSSGGPLINKHFRASLAGDPDKDCVTCTFTKDEIAVRNSENVFSKIDGDNAAEAKEFLLSVRFKNLPDVGFFTINLPKGVKVIEKDIEMEESKNLMFSSHYDNINNDLKVIFTYLNEDNKDLILEELNRKFQFRIECDNITKLNYLQDAISIGKDIKPLGMNGEDFQYKLVPIFEADGENNGLEKIAARLNVIGSTLNIELLNTGAKRNVTIYLFDYQNNLILNKSNSFSLEPNMNYFELEIPQQNNYQMNRYWVILKDGDQTQKYLLSF